MRGIRNLRWACLGALLLLLGPSAGVVLAAERPFISPVQAEIVRGFQPPSHRFGPGHRGIDYGVPPGTPVRASGAGSVSFAGPVAASLYVTLQHPGGVATTYSYLSRVEVSQGDQVGQGQVIGLSGEGHEAEPSSLHFGAKKDGEYIDPRLLLGDFDDITDMLFLAPMTGGGRSVGSGHGFYPARESGDGGGSTLPAGALAGDVPVTPPDLGTGSIPHARVGAGGAAAPVALAPAGVAPVRSAPGIAGGPGPALDLPVRPPFDGNAAGRPNLQGAGPTAAGGSSARTAPTDARWWRDLPEEFRRQLLLEDPERWENFNGLSTAERDEINRRLLDRRIEELEDELDSAAGRRSTRNHRIKTAVKGFISPITVLSKFDREAELERKLRSAKALRNQLQAVATPKNRLSSKDVYLLDFDIAFAGGDGKAVVALGDPATAEHIGVMVPGLNNALGSIAGPLNDAAALRSDVHRRVERNLDKKTSTIVWMGYDNPNGMHDGVNLGEANEGAPWLKSFVNNLRERHADGPGAPHITVLGHSYGSTLTGIAAFDGMKADDIVFLGSPGVGKFGVTADDFPQKRIWSAGPWTDLVTALSGPLGVDPTTKRFNARDVPLSRSQRGHSDYYLRDSIGLENLAKILTNRVPIQ
ncbi:hypothetical protein BH23ACT12_BH23ACT12_23480 [soil metagenome]